MEPTFAEAIAILATGRKPNAAVLAVYEVVEPLCNTDTATADSPNSLYAWLEEGDYDGDETPEFIAAEWDALSE